VLNNAYDVLNRAATAPPEKATLVAKALQQEVNDRGLLEATQELIRNNREQFRFSQQAPNAPAGDAK
jgi:hypothetical protein